LEKEREQHLIRDAANDPSAFAELFEAHFDIILRYCLYHTRQADVARDIAAETFYRALSTIKRYKITTAPFSSWLYRIATNEITNHFRKNKQKKRLLARAMDNEQIVPLEARDYCKAETDALQQLVDEHHTFQTIYTIITSMPLLYREVLILKFIENKNNSEISTIINKKEGTVKSLLSRGVAQLRKTCHKNGLLAP